MPAYYNQRDEIADTLMQQKGASTFDYGLAGLGRASASAHDRANACRPAADASRRRAGRRHWTGCSVNGAATAAANRHDGRDANDGRAWSGAGACKGTGTRRHAAAGAAAQTDDVRMKDTLPRLPAFAGRQQDAPQRSHVV